LGQVQQQVVEITCYNIYFTNLALLQLHKIQALTEYARSWSPLW